MPRAQKGGRRQNNLFAELPVLVPDEPEFGTVEYYIYQYRTQFRIIKEAFLALAHDIDEYFTQQRRARDLGIIREHLEEHYADFSRAVLQSMDGTHNYVDRHISSRNEWLFRPYEVTIKEALDRIVLLNADAETNPNIESAQDAVLNDADSLGHFIVYTFYRGFLEHGDRNIFEGGGRKKTVPTKKGKTLKRGRTLKN